MVKFEEVKTIGMSKRIFLAVFSLLLSCVAVNAFGQADQLERTWYNHEKSSKIQIYKAANGKFYGKIIWLREPNENGKPRIDHKNPEKSLQNAPLLGLVILKDFKKAGDKTYEDGTVYDPKSGKTYSGRITFLGDKLDLRGYVGISLIGRTTSWTRVD